jgi:NAD(P)H-dependent flavin oxidoreductase YrpB (nitropropane dioxygenase family)
METRVSQLLGVDFPILAFSHCRDVVAAVTNAGGFGVLGAVGHSPQALEVDLAWIDDETKGRPYGVDLLLPANYVTTDGPALDRDTVRQLLPAEQQQFVDDILARYEVPPLPDQVDEVQGRLSVTPDSVADLLDVAFSHPIRLVASALGEPPAELVDRAHSSDVLVAALAGTPRHARRHADKGVDLIVAQGTEAGGHTGTISTMVLVPEVVDEVGPIPVLAAGGIGRGSQIAAALALGAEGVWCGSVWLTTAEAETDPSVKEKFLAASSSDTVRSRSLTGKPARMLRSAWTDEWGQPGAPPALPMPLQTMLVTPAQQRINRNATTADSGAQQLATYFVGQVVGSLDRVRPTRQVVLDMVTEYADVAARFAAQAGAPTG